jgi:hypothetical protein
MPQSDIQPRMEACGELAMNVLVSHIPIGSDAGLLTRIHVGKDGI